ncbi:MAG: FAD-binding oxidoreductase [Rhodobacteraceae bacterium]|jgi:glycine/D-amino acid oxidase-like deaminating enzyme|uniref:NAD(P)/FAD-dependent oxidoreductase n=1 Tax=Albidovulum sp. TaxID=1872424 RepID=UPI001DCBC6D4|nr:FAD-dependent oxidoreductase [uncultured Defluviimonas sp.]MCB2126236.1 FAD-binding oxidoreductase [Paracoccaceae bacterium]MCC0069684.1 FAD-binding oxidoreductase [Paracoccaceae bacterium]
MTSDFLIVGGGIAGVSAAARLSHLGRVTLLEAEDHLAHHASGRSAALYEPNYGLAPVIALSHASGDGLRAAGVLTPRGLMLLGAEGEDAVFAEECRNFGLDEISPTEARAIVPILGPRVRRAAIADHAWDIDTDLLIQGFAREARGNGAEILTRARVTGILREGGHWQVTTAAGAHFAGLLVNAAGPWADEVARMAGVRPLGFTPLRRSMARVPAPDGQDTARWPMLMGAGETWYAKPDAGALIVSPAEEDAAEPHDAWADDMVLAEGLARYEDMVTAPVTRLLASWAGLRTFAPDRVLVIGPDPEVPSFFWVAGQGGYGFQTSAAASALVGDLVAGRPPVLDAATVSALSPARFR